MSPVNKGEEFTYLKLRLSKSLSYRLDKHKADLKREGKKVTKEEIAIEWLEDSARKAG